MAHTSDTTPAMLDQLSMAISPQAARVGIVLAAGHGKRIRSETSKMLHEIWGKPTVVRVADAVESGLESPLCVGTSRTWERTMPRVSSCSPTWWRSSTATVWWCRPCRRRGKRTSWPSTSRACGARWKPWPCAARTSASRTSSPSSTRRTSSSPTRSSGTSKTSTAATGPSTSSSARGLAWAPGSGSTGACPWVIAACSPATYSWARACASARECS